jgi:hypothetical protein
MKDIKIFIDDSRNPPEKHSTQDWIGFNKYMENPQDCKPTTWVLCESYDEFEKVVNKLLELKEGWISEISFDYILGHYNYTGASCFKLMAQMITKYGLDVPEKIYIHSEYPKAEQNFINPAMFLSRSLDYKEINLIQIHENGTQTIINPFEYHNKK